MRASRLRALVVLVLALASSDAGAYCRKTTIDPDPAFTPTTTTPCWTEGVPLYWRDAKASYAVNEKASAQVSLPQTEATMALAFAQWTGAMCTTKNGAVKTSLEVRFDGPTPDRLDPADHANVVMFDDALWPHSSPNTTLALTTVTFDPKTGEILDADLEVNTANMQISVGDPVPPGGNDFQSIVTHESGHFLGLAHSIDPKATMFASYTAGSKSMRTLATDDVDGICDVYPPPGGCACTTTPARSRSSAGVSFVIAVMIICRRASRRAQEPEPERHRARHRAWPSCRPSGRGRCA